MIYSISCRARFIRIFLWGVLFVFAIVIVISIWPTDWEQIGWPNWNLFPNEQEREAQKRLERIYHAQTDYYTRFGSFASDLDLLYIGLKHEPYHYRVFYSDAVNYIVYQANPTAEYKDQIRAYAFAIYREQNGFSTIMCEADNASIDQIIAGRQVKCCDRDSHKIQESQNIQ